MSTEVTKPQTKSILNIELDHAIFTDIEVYGKQKTGIQFFVISDSEESVEYFIECDQEDIMGTDTLTSHFTSTDRNGEPYHNTAEHSVFDYDPELSDLMPYICRNLHNCIQID